MPWRDLPTVKDHSLQPRHLGDFAMAADPAILKRIRACPFARGGRVLVRFRANGDSLFARRSGEPLARLRLTGHGGALFPSPLRGAVGAPAADRQRRRGRAALPLAPRWLGALGDFGASAMRL